MVMKPALYPTTYTWLVFMSAMDIMMTWIVLYFGGNEANPLANAILRKTGLVGIVAFKFILVTLLVFIAEYVGRRNFAKGRRFAWISVAITCIPVTLAFVQLLTFNLMGFTA